MDDYVKLYAGMADEELVSLGGESDALTESAREALWAEIETRGLSQEASSALEEHRRTAQVRGAAGAHLVTVCVLSDATVADHLRSRLEAEGIDCFVTNQHLGRLTGVFPYAIGGLEVQVEEADAERARAIVEGMEL